MLLKITLEDGNNSIERKVQVDESKELFEGLNEIADSMYDTLMQNKYDTK